MDVIKPVSLLIAMVLLSAACSSEPGPGTDGPPPDAALSVEGMVDAGDAKADAEKPDQAAWSCPSYQAGVSAGKVNAAAITETSGLEVSSENAGVLWLHNDSGDTARVFAISSTGESLGEYFLTGANSTDWEDMALGPGPTDGKTYLYLGDIGDNLGVRANVVVYRVAEPAVSATQQPVTEALSGVESLTFVYPDGPRNAETLLVDPRNGDIYIVAKTGALPAGIYQSPAPQDPVGTRTLVKVGEVVLNADITGGDISDDGSEILLRTYFTAQLWHWPAGTALGTALGVSACRVQAVLEPQGEAIAFEPKTKNYYTLSEFASQPLYRYVRN